MEQTAEEAAVASFVRGIDVQPVDADRFEAAADRDEDDTRIFGGQTLAQAVVAAGRTVADATIHSLHAYFLRPGKPQQAITYVVERTRDGRAFAGRHVSAMQGETLIFEAALSFVRPEDGISHQLTMPPGDDPETLDDVFARRREHIARWGNCPAFDMVEAPKTRPASDGTGVPKQKMWWRPVAPLPEDPVIHAAAFAWVSDNMLYATVYEPYGLPTGVTLDHAIWWHRPPRFDGWILRVSESPAANAARALMLSSVFNKDGTMVASIAQEGLFRRSW